jgi:hypothetical protein
VDVALVRKVSDEICIGDSRNITVCFEDSYKTAGFVHTFDEGGTEQM